MSQFRTSIGRFTEGVLASMPIDLSADNERLTGLKEHFLG
jgi:hypothetical protein